MSKQDMDRVEASASQSFEVLPEDDSIHSMSTHGIEELPLFDSGQAPKTMN